MNTRQSFGRKIAEARTMAKLTQKELAERADITQNNLSRIENGRYKPGLDILLQIADALDMQLTFTSHKN
jgi:HTH-type transcriptional repressor of puuD